MSLLHISPFMKAMDEGRGDDLNEHLSDDVVLLSPFVPDPISGREDVLEALQVLLSVTKYTTDTIIEGEGRAAVIFRIRAGDVEVTGVDDMTVDKDDRISGMSVQWRPLAKVVAIQQLLAPLLGVPSFELVEKQS